MWQNTNQTLDQNNESQQSEACPNQNIEDDQKSQLIINIVAEDEQNIYSFLPNDSLLRLLLNKDVTITQILSHTDFNHTFELNNNALIEKICLHMKQIIDLLRVDDNIKDEKIIKRTSICENVQNSYLLAHHASQILSSDSKEISFLFFPPKDKKNQNKKHKEKSQSIYTHNDILNMEVTSAYESDAQLNSPCGQQYNSMKKSSDIYNFLEDQNDSNKQNDPSSKHSSLLSSVQKRNSYQIKQKSICQDLNDQDLLKQFLSLICDFQPEIHSISISYFYQVFLTFFNRDTPEIEYYIYEKLSYFCDRLIQLISDGTIMDLVLLLLNQPKSQSNSQIGSTILAAQVESNQNEKNCDEEERRNIYYFSKKKEIIEGLFDTLSFYKFNEEAQKKRLSQCSNMDASAFNSQINLEDQQIQRQKSKDEELTYDPEIIFWRMKNSCMIICEILDHFQDINRGEDLGFIILNYYSQQVFQSLSSNKIDEISFSCDVAQHLLAFLQNEDIQFRIEFETIKGNIIVEKYFKESILSIKKELMLAQQKKIDSFHGQFGEKIAMFQAHRLKLIKLIELAFSFKIKDVVQEIFDQDILQIIIEMIDFKINFIKKILFFQYEWNNQLHLNVMNLFETIIEIAQQNDNPSWIFYVRFFQYFVLGQILFNNQIIKRVKIVNYIISNSDQSFRKIINPKTKQSQIIQKSYIGHLKKLAETLMKCLEQNSHYQVWIEDQSKWTELVEMVTKQQNLLKGKLGEKEDEKKQKFELNCNAKKSLLNRRKKLQEGKKESQTDNNTLSVNNTEVFQRLNSPIKKTITLQVGTPKQIKRRTTDDEEDEERESVSSLKSKKELQQAQIQKQYLMDSPMLKSKNSTPLLSHSSSLSNSQIGLRTPKTPMLSTPTRTSSNAPQTPNMKKLLLSSPLQNNFEGNYQDNLGLKDSIKNKFLPNDQESETKKRRRKKSLSDYYSSNHNSLDNQDLDSSNSSISSIDSQKSRSSSLDRRVDQRIKVKELHNQLLQDLDLSFSEDETKNFTFKHSIKIDDVGLQFINKKEKRLFDWNQNAEDEEEEEKFRQRQEENFKRILQEQAKNQNNSCLNLFNTEAAQVISQRRQFLNSVKNLSPQLHCSNGQSRISSPNKFVYNSKSPNENHKNNSVDELNPYNFYSRQSPYAFGLSSNYSNSSPIQLQGGLKKKNFNTESPCIQVNKQYFRYLIRDTIRKYSYDHQLDPKIKQIQDQCNQVKSCPQNTTFKSAFNLEDCGGKNFRKLLPMKNFHKSRNSNLSFESLSNFLNLSNSSKDNIHGESAPKSMESLSYLRSPNKSTKVNLKLIKQVRDNLDISDGSSHSLTFKSRENIDEKTPSKQLSENGQIDKCEFSQSENSSEDEKEKLQQREKFYERKNVKKKSTFYQQKLKQTKPNCEQQKFDLKIVEEAHAGSTQIVIIDQGDSNNKTTSFNKKNFNKQNSQEKALNQKLKAKINSMNIENESEANSYGDLEDFSPLIKKPKKNLSKKTIFSDKQLANKSNKNVSSQDDEIDKNLKIDNNQINSTTSIQKNIENIIVEENENMNSHRRDDQVFLNLISNQDCSKQIKITNKQNTIANILINRSSKSKKSQFSQPIVYCESTKFIEDRNSLINYTNNQVKQVSSLSAINNIQCPPKTISQNSQNSQNSQSYLNYHQSSTEQFPYLESFQSIPVFKYESLEQIKPNEANEKDQDLINKILLRQENSTSANSVILRVLDAKSQSQLSQKEQSQEEMFYSQTVINNE